MPSSAEKSRERVKKRKKVKKTEKLKEQRKRHRMKGQLQGSKSLATRKFRGAQVTKQWERCAKRMKSKEEQFEPSHETEVLPITKFDCN